MRPHSGSFRRAGLALKPVRRWRRNPTRVSAGQQIGGAVGLAIIGTVVWTTVNNNLRHHLGTAHAAPTPGSAIYNHALSHGAGIGLGIGAAAAVLALVIAVIAIRVRRQDLPAGPVIL